LVLTLLVLSAAAIVLAKGMPEFLPFDQAVPITFATGIGLAALALVLLLTSLKRTLVRSARIAAARGTDYSKIPLRICWSCALPTPAKVRRCLFCGAEPKAPRKNAEETSGGGIHPGLISAAADPADGTRGTPAIAHDGCRVARRARSVGGAAPPLPMGEGSENGDAVPPPLPAISHAVPATPAGNGTKQGAAIGGWLCFLLGAAVMYWSVWAFVLYVPLFFVTFILSIVAMAQRRIVAGILLLLATLAVPPVQWLALSSTRMVKFVKEHAPPPRGVVAVPGIPKAPASTVQSSAKPQNPTSPDSRNAGEEQWEAATETSAPPLKNGVLIDSDLNVAVVKFERHLADPSLRPTLFMPFDRDVDGADITLAFRRMSTQWYKSSSDVRSRLFQLIMTDDRGNEYSGLYCLAGSRVLYGGSFSLDDGMYGTPPSVQQMPVGFTWTGKVKVKIPPSAPITRVELKRERFGAMFQKSDTRRFPMNFREPTDPDFEFDVPSQLLLSEGVNIEAGRDVTAKIGHLAVQDFYTMRENSGYGPLKTVRGLSLSLPIEAANMDYNPHTATVPRLSVQFENGEVIRNSEERVMQSAQMQDSPNFWSGSQDFEIPGKSVRTLTLRIDISERMNAEVGLNVRRILLYGKDGFRGFVLIPDDARQRIAAIAGKGSAQQGSSAQQGERGIF
jgi:hypothetical protein